MASERILRRQSVNECLTLAVQIAPVPDRPPWLNRLLAALGVPTARLAVAEALAVREAHADAFRLFVQAAQAGLPRARYRVGRSYLLGLGVPPSIGEALRWLRRAAEAGDVPAQTQLATLALQGVSDDGAAGLFGDGDRPQDSPTSDFRQAERWCRQAVAAGSVEAKALLAFILTAGPDAGRDPAAGEALYQQAAAGGWSRGQLGVAMTLLRDGTTRSAAEAVDLLRAAAADDIAAAHHLLGMLAESGAAGSVDFEAAADSYKAAADLGYAQAQVRYGFALLLGRGTQRDVFTAETWLRRAALTGDAQAAAVIGFLYARDGDLPPNHAEAGLWLRRAAEAGHTGAARTLARMLLQGAGTPRDVPEAARWLRVAGDGGDQAARADLVHLALTRQVGPDDRIAVAGWLRQGAAAGDPAAQFDLGLCLAQGIGTEQDDEAAFVWVHRAADAGHAGAARMVAQLAGHA